MHQESGQTTTEYGLILVLISIAAIGVLTVMAGSVYDLYADTQVLLSKLFA